MAGYQTPAWGNNQSPAISAAALLAMGQGIELAEHAYGVCNTATATTAKVVTIDFSGTLALFTGLTVRVKMKYAGYGDSMTLNVNSTGAKSIVGIGGTQIRWRAGEIVTFTYDGTNWLVSSRSNEVQFYTSVYWGTGTSGSSNPTRITFPGQSSPLLLIVYNITNGSAGLAPYPYSTGWSDSFIWCANQSATAVNNSTLTFSSGAGFVEWYASNATSQLNGSGLQYYVLGLYVV